MLVLMRKVGGEIVIGNEEIVITVVEVRGNKVRLGVTAPKRLQVHRREVFDAVKGQGGVDRKHSESEPLV
jgi:carbon storage regulator